MISPTRLGELYGVDVIDYGRKSRGLLLHNGCGLGLAVMDACPELNYVVDMTGWRLPLLQRHVSFLETVAWSTSGVVAALVFFADYPDAAVEALSIVAGQQRVPIVYTSNATLGEYVRAGTFDELQEAVTQWVG